MNATEARVEEAIAKMDQEEAKTTDETDKKTTTEDDGAGKQTAGADDTKDKSTTDKDEVADDKKTDEDKDADKDSDEDAGTFTADDALEVDEPVPPTNEVAPTDAAGIQLTGAEQKYIAENIGSIGDPVTFSGTIDGKEVSYKVYDVRQLPANFQPDSVVSFQQGLKTLDTMEKKAETLLQTYRQNQNQSQAREFEQRENEAIRQDVSELQKDGDFPKFKVKPGEQGFDDDNAAKLMADVMGLMNDRNNQYLKEYNAGRAYRHIGFREAYELYQARNAKTTSTKVADDAQTREDEERKTAGTRVSGNRGTSNDSVVKPTIRSGTTIEQILARHEQEL